MHNTAEFKFHHLKDQVSTLGINFNLFYGNALSKRASNYMASMIFPWLFQKWKKILFHTLWFFFSVYITNLSRCLHHFCLRLHQNFTVFFCFYQIFVLFWRDFLPFKTFFLLFRRFFRFCRDFFSFYMDFFYMNFFLHDFFCIDFFFRDFFCRDFFFRHDRDFSTI